MQRPICSLESTRICFSLADLEPLTPKPAVSWRGIAAPTKALCPRHSHGRRDLHLTWPSFACQAASPAWSMHSWAGSERLPGAAAPRAPHSPGAQSCTPSPQDGPRLGRFGPTKSSSHRRQLVQGLPRASTMMLLSIVRTNPAVFAPKTPVPPRLMLTLLPSPTAAAVPR